MTGAERRARIEATRVYLVLSESACGGLPWRDAFASALESGVVGAVQVREKEMDDGAFVERAREVARAARAADALVLLDDRVHLVAVAGADGAHVGEDDLDPREARRLLGDQLLLGVSTHDAAEARDARSLGADHGGLGPCFATSTKALSRAPRGADLLREALPVASVPLFPIGGIDPGNVGLLAAAGATRVAVGAGVLAAADPAAAARAIAAALVPAPRGPRP
jgi:thiamine-phosphate diphosphorylase